MNYLYKNWAYMCLPIAVYVLLLLFSFMPILSLAVFLIWLQFPVYLLHQFEEHAKPGGFKQYINTHVFNISNQDVPLNDKNIFWINIPFIWVLFPLCALLAQNVWLPIGVILPVFGLFNATLHVLSMIRFREYNPGLVVSLLLNFPTGIYTIWFFLNEHLVSTNMLWLALLIAFFSHLLIVAVAVMEYKRYVK